MSFLKDLFGPLWKHSDPSVRLSELETLKDQNILSHIAINDEVDSIRVKAINKIDDQLLLAEVLRDAKDPAVCENAVEKIHDQTLLADIASSDKHPKVRYTALQKLSSPDQKLLSHIAINDEDALNRKAAINKLDDQKLLTDIASCDKDSHVRYTALQKLSSPDQKMLTHAAINESYSSIREAAINRLNDQTLLKEVLQNAKDPDVREIALAKISDQTLIQHIASNDKDDRIRNAARSLVKDTAFRLRLTECIDAVKELEKYCGYFGDFSTYVIITNYNSWVNEHASKLNQLGLLASTEIAILIEQLVHCRNEYLPVILRIASKIRPSDKLINSIEAAKEAKGVISAPANMKFNSQLTGRQGIAWTDRTEDAVHKIANEAIEAFGKDK